MFALGIILGILAATSQSLSYIASRWFTTTRGGMVRLLTIGHVLQGVVCLPLMVIIWPDAAPPLSQWWLRALGMSGLYMLGQVGIFAALRYADASRISPLLGLKIAILAVVSAVLLGDPLSTQQWIGVGLAVAAAFLLNYSGGGLPAPALAALVVTLVGYCGSDTCIQLMYDAMPAVPRLHAAVFATSVSYVISGVAFAVLLPWRGSRDVSVWKAAIPYAASWLAAMFFLFGCFALVGIVLGNILQSLRGLISIGLGVLIASRGHLHIESHVPRTVLVRRAAAAGLMVAAIAVYVLGR